MHVFKRFIGKKSGLVAALVGVAAMGLTAATTLGNTAFTAQVSNTSNTFDSGTLLLSKTINGGTACLSNSSNAANTISTNINSSCSGSDLPNSLTDTIGNVLTASIVLTNVGNVTSSSGLSLTTGACTLASGGNPPGTGADALATGTDTAAGFCGNTWVTIENDTGTPTCVYPAQAGACPTLSSSNTLTGLASATKTIAATLAPGAANAQTLTIKSELGTGATNADQGLAASLPMTYTLTQ